MAETHPGTLLCVVLRSDQVNWALGRRKADEKAHYQSSEWPDPDLVSVLVKNGQ